MSSQVFHRSYPMIEWKASFDRNCFFNDFGEDYLQFNDIINGYNDSPIFSGKEVVVTALKKLLKKHDRCLLTNNGHLRDSLNNIPNALLEEKIYEYDHPKTFTCYRGPFSVRLEAVDADLQLDFVRVDDGFSKVVINGYNGEVVQINSTGSTNVCVYAQGKPAAVRMWITGYRFFDENGNYLGKEF